MSLTTEATPSAAVAEPTNTWYQEFYEALDAKDISVVDRLCTPDTRVQFANHEPCEGRAAVREVLLHFWSTIERMQHRFTNVFEVDDQALLCCHQGRHGDPSPCWARRRPAHLRRPDAAHPGRTGSRDPAVKRG
jgi:hypothetical protein